MSPRTPTQPRSGPAGRAHHRVSVRGGTVLRGAHSALLELAEVSDIRVVILRLSHVTTLDATGAAVLSDTIRSLENRGITVLLSGLPQQFTARLEATGILQRLRDQNHVFGHPGRDRTRTPACGARRTSPHVVLHATDRNQRQASADAHALGTWTSRSSAVC